MARLFVLFGLLLGLAGPALCQDRATLLADSLFLVGGNRLIAETIVQKLIRRRLLPKAD